MPLLAVIWAAMGIDSCEGPPEFPEPGRQSLSPDEGAEVLRSWELAVCSPEWERALAGVWSCGEPSSGPRAGVEGSGSVIGTALDGELPGSFDDSIEAPPVDLSAEAGAPLFLSIWHWHDFTDAFAANRGGGRVEVLDDGGWVPLVPEGGYDGRIIAPGTSLNREQGFTGSGPERVWRRSFFDLSGYGGGQLRIRFHAANRTPPWKTREGWYVDEIRVWRGTFSAQPPDTEMDTCEPGASVLFAIDACDAGFGVSGDGAWQCGVPTRNSDPDRADGPLTDGPAYDRDGSRLLWGTALSGDFEAGGESALVSPAIDAGSCVGGTLLLGFWHWYHFGPGGGGFVQVFDGEAWVDVAPAGGYPGEIGGGMPWRRAHGHEAFVSASDEPSGWRFTTIDISRYAHPELRVRFVASTDRGEQRPGWYVDTIEVTRDALDAVAPIQGDPSQPQCGLSPQQLDGRQLYRDVKRDPCLYGEPLVSRERFVHRPEAQRRPSSHRLSLEVPGPGSLCVSLHNGDRRVSFATATFDGAPLIGEGELAYETAGASEVVRVRGGEHDLHLLLDGDEGDYVEVSVGYLAGNQTVPLVDENGVSTGVSNFMVGYHDEPRMSDGASRRQETLRLWDIAFDVDAAMPSYAVRGLSGAFSYVVQIMDAKTCEQVREIEGWQGSWKGEQGDHLGPFQVRLRWDGTDDDGDPVPVPGDYIFRVTGTPARIDTMPAPPNGDGGETPELGGELSPIAGGGFTPPVITADVEIPFDPSDLKPYQSAGIAEIDHLQGASVLGTTGAYMAGGESILFGLFLPAEIWLKNPENHYSPETPEVDSFLEAIDVSNQQGSNYQACPEDSAWNCEEYGPYPIVNHNSHKLNIVDLRGRAVDAEWEATVKDFPVAESLSDFVAVPAAFCGWDSYHNHVCADVAVKVDLPKDHEDLFRFPDEPSQDLEFYLQYSDDPITEGAGVFETIAFDDPYDPEDPQDEPMVQSRAIHVASPALVDVYRSGTNDTNEIRWQDEVFIEGGHLWAYAINQPDVEEYRVSLCVFDGEAVMSPEGGVWPKTEPNGYPHHGNMKFEMWEHPFKLDGSQTYPVDTDLSVRGYFTDDCWNANFEPFPDEIYNTDDGITLVPPRLNNDESAVEGGEMVGDEVHVEIEVGQSFGVFGYYLFHYSDKGYLTGRLLGGTGDDIIFPDYPNAQIGIPADHPLGDYYLDMSFTDGDLFSSDIERPEILVSIVDYAVIDEVKSETANSKEEWRSDSDDGGNYHLSAHIDEGANALEEDPSFKIVVGENADCDDPGNAVVQDVFDWPGNDYGKVFFRFPFSAEIDPDQIVTICSEHLEGGSTSFEGFRVLGYENGAMSKSTLIGCTQAEGAPEPCSFSCGDLTIDVNTYYNSDGEAIEHEYMCCVSRPVTRGVSFSMAWVPPSRKSADRLG